MEVASVWGYFRVVNHSVGDTLLRQGWREFELLAFLVVRCSALLFFWVLGKESGVSPEMGPGSFRAEEDLWLSWYLEIFVLV